MAEQVEATVLKIGTAPLFQEPQDWSFPAREIAMDTVIDGDINTAIHWGDNIYYVSETLADLVTAANDGGGGSGSSLFPTTGTGTALGGVIADLDGNTLTVESDELTLLQINPTGFQTTLGANDGVNGSSALTLFGNSSGRVSGGISMSDGVGQGNLIIYSQGGDEPLYYWELNATDGENTVEIEGDAIEDTITYTATHHKPNLVEYADNAAAITGGLTAGDLYMTSGSVKIVT